MSSSVLLNDKLNVYVLLRTKVKEYHNVALNKIKTYFNMDYVIQGLIGWLEALSDQPNLPSSIQPKKNHYLAYMVI